MKKPVDVKQAAVSERPTPNGEASVETAAVRLAAPVPCGAPMPAGSTTHGAEKTPAAPQKREAGAAASPSVKPPAVELAAAAVPAAKIETTPALPNPVMPSSVTADVLLPRAGRPPESRKSPEPAEAETLEPVSGEATVEELPPPELLGQKVEEELREAVSEPSPPPPQIPPMYVVMVTPELAPVAKVGGLADVVFGLSRELELRGNTVEIILPKYDCMRYDQIWGLSHAYDHLQVPWFNGIIDTTVWFGYVHGRKCFFIDPHSPDNFFNRRSIYGHNDDVIRFAFFCRAALEYMYKAGKRPEIIHCHDWQTGLTPVLLYEIYQHLGMKHSRVCFTIHNFRHQGVTGGNVLRATGLDRPEHFFHYDRLRDDHNPQALNLAKGGIVYSNFVTTVSPRHAGEAKDGGQAHGLEPTLNRHHYKFGGVLNGVDYEVYNPETDPHIPSHYNAQTIEKKYGNKRALRQRLWLAENGKPLIAFIGRLDPQKGLDLVWHSMFYGLSNRAQFVLLGESPDRSINDHFWGLKRRLNNNPDCHLEIGYNEELGHLIYAGADLMLAPSRFEPCGLTQLISMRYGTVPVVRSVGGLADTVFDKDFASRPLHERNGYMFHHADNAGVESALRRAIGCYYHFPDHFRHLMLNGMRCDYSWKQPGQHYLNIYNHIRDK